MSYVINQMVISSPNGLTIGNGTISTSGMSGAQTIQMPAISDTLVALTTNDTLLNKTLIAPVITSLISGTGTINFPNNVNDTVVLRNTTDILTNKTLTTPVITSLISGTGTINFPTNVSDTVVLRSTVDSLTNKTLTGTTNIIQASHIGQGTSAVQVSGVPQVGYSLIATGTGTASWQNENEPNFIQGNKTTTGTATNIITIPMTVNSAYLIVAKVIAKCLVTGSINYYACTLTCSYCCGSTLSTVSQLQSDALVTFTKTKPNSLNFSCASSSDSSGNVYIVVNGGSVTDSVNWSVNAEYITV